MASTKKKCAYVKCKCDFYGGKRAIYCSQKCGQYQRRLDSKEGLEFVEVGDITSYSPITENERKLIGLTVSKSELPHEVKRGDIEIFLIDGKAVEFLAIKVGVDDVFFGEYFE